MQPTTEKKNSRLYLIVPGLEIKYRTCVTTVYKQSLHCEVAYSSSKMPKSSSTDRKINITDAECGLQLKKNNSV